MSSAASTDTHTIRNANHAGDPIDVGVVYFDELQAFATDGRPVLTNGTPVTMVDSRGSTRAAPLRLTDFTFKVIYEGD